MITLYWSMRGSLQIAAICVARERTSHSRTEYVRLLVHMPLSLTSPSARLPVDRSCCCRYQCCCLLTTSCRCHPAGLTHTAETDTRSAPSIASEQTTTIVSCRALYHTSHHITLVPHHHIAATVCLPPPITSNRRQLRSSAIARPSLSIVVLRCTFRPSPITPPTARHCHYRALHRTAHLSFPSFSRLLLLSHSLRL